MLDVFHIAKPQGCDIQIFYGSGVNNNTSQRSWIKPRGVSHVYALLIGPGAVGDGTFGGGSGAVTVWYGAAQNVPDQLTIRVAVSSTNSQILYQSKSGLIVLLQADQTSLSTGAAAFTANQFAASGFYQSVAGQNGVASGIGASGTSFLNGGTTAASAASTLYGYQTSSGGVNGNGFFMMQPIIVGGGGTGSGRGGIGCGGGANSGPGGPGMVLIASW